MAAKSTNESVGGTEYVTNTFWTQTQNFKSSARLYLQHWLFQSTLGFTFAPPVLDSLSKNDGLIRVADIACGNCAWLIDASTTLASINKDAELVGFDIQPSFFPAKDFLPSNVSLKQQDILSETPADVVEAFDVVHVRAFISIIRNNDPTPFLQSILKMLRPGGWIQWDEAPQDRMVAVAPKSGATGAQHTNMLLKYLEAGAKQSGIPYDWIANLDSDLTKQNLHDVAITSYPLQPTQYKAWTEDYLIVWESIVDMLPSKEKAPTSPATKESFLAILAPAVEEMSKGVVAHSQELIVATGRKGT